MNMFRISKYDPNYKTSKETLNDVWTDYSDVGSVFCGSILTIQEYLSVEEKYILCIMTILQTAHINCLYVNSLENYENTKWVNGQRLASEMFSDVFRDCLRNKCWCKLEASDAYVHFGYDYYMYAGVSLPYETVRVICKKHNLFCELLESPYHNV